MELAFAAFLIIVTFVSAAALAIGVPLTFGLMAWDLVQGRKNAPPVIEQTTWSIAAKRGVARAFVLLGGAFWSVASFAGLYEFRQSGAGDALLAALIPLGACAVTLVIGWYWERVTAALMLAASLAVVAWGVIYQFEPGVWMIMTFALLGPMMTASVLFWLARKDQEAYERVTSLRPDLAFVFAARSSLHAAA